MNEGGKKAGASPELGGTYAPPPVPSPNRVSSALSSPTLSSLASSALFPSLVCGPTAGIEGRATDKAAQQGPRSPAQHSLAEGCTTGAWAGSEHEGKDELQHDDFASGDALEPERSAPTLEATLADGSVEDDEVGQSCEK